MAVYAVVQSGVLVSSGVTLEKGDRPFTVLVPSMAGASLHFEFASEAPSVATSGQYFTLHADGGAGAPYTAYSASAPGATYPVMGPTPFVRLRLGATVGAPRSFTILPVQPS